MNHRAAAPRTHPAPPPHPAPPLGQKRIMPSVQPGGSHPRLSSGTARHHDLGPPDLRNQQRSPGSGLQPGERARPRSRRRLSFRSRHDVGDPRRLRVQPPRDDPGLSRHRQIDPCRAGRRAAQLALHPRQPRQPHQPHRPRRQGRDRLARQQAGDRIPRRLAALGVAASDGVVLRRIRCRPPRRHVRDPARARGRGQADPARPEPGDPAAFLLPAVLDREHGRPRRHDRPLSRHAADQPGPDGPLEHRRDTELPAARRRGRHRLVESAGLRQRRGPADRSARWWRWPI